MKPNPVTNIGFRPISAVIMLYKIKPPNNRDFHNYMVLDNGLDSLLGHDILSQRADEPSQIIQAILLP